MDVSQLLSIGHLEMQDFYHSHLQIFSVLKYEGCLGIWDKQSTLYWSIFADGEGYDTQQQVVQKFELICWISEQKEYLIKVTFLW